VVKDAGSEQHALEQLDVILRSNLDTAREWERLMKTLLDGVIDALAYLSGRSGRGGIQRFYAHGLTEPFDPSPDLELDVAVSECVSIPNLDDQVFLNDILYRVRAANLADDRVIIRISRA
jgi:hypothetical protein